MKTSHLENRFDLYWKALRGPQLASEHRFHPVRKWRFDRAFPAAKVAIEIEGGTWTRGRHNRGSGYEKDCAKYHAAALDGWYVFRLTAGMLTAEFIEPIINFCRGKQGVKQAVRTCQE